MPRSTLNSNGMNTGSNYQFGDKMIAPNAPRSAFDWSSQLIRNIQQAGQVLPIACYEVLPKSSVCTQLRQKSIHSAKEPTLKTSKSAKRLTGL